jgi:hypothetical protein
MNDAEYSYFFVRKIIYMGQLRHVGFDDSWTIHGKECGLSCPHDFGELMAYCRVSWLMREYVLYKKNQRFDAAAVLVVVVVVVVVVVGGWWLVVGWWSGGGRSLVVVVVAIL